MDAGLPTALAVSSLIAVGTSHGLILVFGMSKFYQFVFMHLLCENKYYMLSCFFFATDFRFAAAVKMDVG